MYNEILSLAGLLHGQTAFGPKEMAECNRILKCAEEKVLEVDQYLVYERKAA